MPLSNKLKADYVELINSYLDNLPITTIDEFELIRSALKNMVTPVEDYVAPEALQDRMTTISELLDSPEIYVDLPEDYAEYQEILRQRISAKEDEFLSFNDEQKISYILEKQANRAKAAEVQVRLAAHEPPLPGSDAHVLTEDEWLMQMQDEFQDAAPIAPSFVGLQSWVTMPRPLPLDSQQGILSVSLASVSSEEFDDDSDQDDFRPILRNLQY